MRRTVFALACGVYLLAWGAPARAGGTIYLTWNDCAQNGVGVPSMDFLCDANTGQEDLYLAFTMPQATGADVEGIIAVVDIQHSAATLPEWWKLAESGGCRTRNLLASGDFSGNTTCTDPWQGRAAAEVQGYDVGSPRGGANQARIKVTCTSGPGFERTLDTLGMYYGVRLTLLNGLSTGSGACAGCLGSACLVLNSIEVIRTAGAPGGDLFISSPGPANANWALWQGGQGANCALVPARNLTWGRLKSLYR